MHVFWGRNNERTLVPQIDLCPGLNLDLMSKFRIHARTGHRERLQCGWRLERAIDQHAASSVGCFAARLSAFDHQNAGPAPAQRDGKGEADDPSADDDYVPTLHSGIVKDGRSAAPFRLPGTGDRQSPAAYNDGMMRIMLGALLLIMLAAATVAVAQKDKDNEPTTWVYFTVVKDDTGKPVRNAAVIMHPVNEKGSQERGGLELKTDPDGKANFDGVPYGPLRVQVLARGFQTFGEDYTIQKDKTEITIKLKRPQGQFSIYDDPASNPPPKQDPKQENPPADAKKPN